MDVEAAENRRKSMPDFFFFLHALSAFCDALKSSLVEREQPEARGLN